MGFFDRLKDLKRYDDAIKEKKKSIAAATDDLKEVYKKIDDANKELAEVKSKIEIYENERDEVIASKDEQVQKTEEACKAVIANYQERRDTARELCLSVEKQYKNALQELQKSNKEIELNKEKTKLYQSLKRKIVKSITENAVFLTDEEINLNPTVELHLNSFDSKDLRKLINENKKVIEVLLGKYERRYTTKSNKAIYQLLVLALRAEFQNIIIDLRYSNYDKCEEKLNEAITRYMQIASDGNQQIAPVIKKFIDEMHTLLKQALDIEYTYFVRKEQEKAEQQALREQMRQEIAERKALELEQKKVEKEEEKYKTEIANTEKALSDCKDEEKIKKLLDRIEELKDMLIKVEERKEEIINRQNGKAGYVYVISNLGSFGDKRFKVGMTRRLEPMDRVKELGDASVPFSFDVHSFIFSEDAVALECDLHKRLESKRTNKINSRKEFFDISIDELEKLVSEICPSAEFKRTMLAIEYKKGLELALRNKEVK